TSLDRAALPDRPSGHAEPDARRRGLEGRGLEERAHPDHPRAGDGAARHARRKVGPEVTSRAFRAKIGWPDGSVAEEAIQAPDAATARVEIERRGGHVFEVRREGLSFADRRQRRGRIKMRDFLIFNQELIALLKAGLPVVHA